MAYHTGVYTKAPDWIDECEVVWERDGFTAYKWQGRLWLVKNGYRIAELVNGFESLEKTYKGSVQVWIEKLQQKDEKKIRGIREKMENLEQDINIIESIWS